MSEPVALALAAAGTAAATGLGAVPVAVFGAAWTAHARAALEGLAAGCMAVASVLGLLLPGIDDGGLAPVLAGALAGALFLALVRRHLGDDPAAALPVSAPGDAAAPRGAAPAAAPSGAVTTPGFHGRWAVVALVLFAHSVPEGFAIGTAYASETAGLGLFVLLAIALQNVPEGTATAVPMQDAGYRGPVLIVAAIATSLPQVPGALAAYFLVGAVEPLLPFSFGFAAGAMLCLVIVDVLPEALAEPWKGLAGIAAGGAAMAALARVAGV